MLCLSRIFTTTERTSCTGVQILKHFSHRTCPPPPSLLVSSCRFLETVSLISLKISRRFLEQGVGPGHVVAARRGLSTTAGRSSRDNLSTRLYLDGVLYFLDVQENRYGRVLKISKVDTDGYRTQLQMNPEVSQQINKKLSEIVRDLQKGDQQPVKPEVIHDKNKRFDISLVQNRTSGKLVQIVESKHGRVPYTLTIPYNSIKTLQQSLDLLVLEAFGSSMAVEHNLIESRHVRAQNKEFNVDCMEDKRGERYLVIKEHKRRGLMSTLTVELASCRTLINLFNDIVEEASTSEGAGGKTSPPFGTLHSRTLELEKKDDGGANIYLTVKVNQAGRFLEVKLVQGNQHTFIFVPDSAWKDFVAAVADIADSCGGGNPQNLDLA